MQTFHPYDKVKKGILKDAAIKQAYDDLEPLYSFITVLIRKRLELGMSQKELAEKVGTKQSAIARLESGTYNPSIKFLQKVAAATDSELYIKLQ